MTEIYSKAKAVLLKYRLCNRCLGRLLQSGEPIGGERKTGDAIKASLLEEAEALLSSSREEAIALIEALAESGYGPAKRLASELGLELKDRVCPICMGRLTDEAISALVEASVSKVSGYEFEDFLVGAYVPKHIASIEERIISEFGLTDSETLRKEIAREVGSRLEVRLGKPANFNSPEILILVDIFTGTAEARPSPLYIFGHYFKSQPNTPQTPWYCSVCWGAGCERCGGLGRVYPDSVAEYIGEPAMQLAGAIGYKFHAAGREDVDVTVEGGGRPFIIELIMPRRRMLSLEVLEREVRSRSAERVWVERLRFANRSDLELLKESMEGAVKRYRALVRFERPVSAGDLVKLETTFRGAVIEQVTPIRVLRRRGERLRRKRLISIRPRLLDEYTVEIDLEADGGLYVKELIHGDQGRTRPNIAETLGNTPVSISLKFLGVQRASDRTK